MSQVLIVDDDREMAHGMCEALRRSGHAVDVAWTGRQGLQRLEASHYDIVVSDLRLPDVDGREVLATARRLRPETPVMLVTAFASVDSAVDCLREGATDYLTKPFSPEALVRSVAACLRGRKTVAVSVPSSGDLIAEDPRTKQVLQEARRASLADATVLLEGESGSGKEVFARWIHGNGSRAEQPFVAVNCAAIPRELLEAELFGHARGAFTGAHRDRRGLFRAADRGTLLLDEIGEMPADLQARLLRVVQDRSIQPLGSEQTIPVDVRLIAATHRDLAQEVEAGRFRHDLYYRLRVVPIYIPPLRERPGDIEPLARHVLQRAGADFDLTAQAVAALREHPWPGNVRELENVLQRALVHADAERIDEAALQFDPTPAGGLQPPVVQTLDDAERDAIRRCLEFTRGNRAEAARRLGISPRTLRHKLKQYRDNGRPLEGCDE